MDKYNEWLNNPYFDDSIKDELKKIENDEQEIKERFFNDLEFGTAGLRGIIGAGTARINIYNVRKAIQGFSNFLLKEYDNASEKGIAIAYDCRRMSPEFADEAASVLNGNGIKAYVFPSLRATPILSYAVRELDCVGGIMVTASHNPPEYNGIKVYGPDGAQIVYPYDEKIINEVNNILDFSTIKIMDKEKGIKEGLYNIIDKKLDNKYIEIVKKHSLNPEIIKEVEKDINIIYTPLNGTGNIPVRKILKAVGFSNVHVVSEQELPDSEFTTVGYPNPEDPKVFKLAEKLGHKYNGDILIATDPDADRLGAMVRIEDEYIFLNGNMIGSLLAEYILSQLSAQNKLPENPVLISTIVSTDITKAIAKNYNAKYIDVLTGFKYIGEKIKEFEEDNSYDFIFGFEESYGFLAGTYARDKDAVAAGMLLCEALAYYKSRGMNLLDGLEEIHEKYGYYLEDVKSITLEGLEGREKINNIMKDFRTNPPKKIGGYEITEFRDYESSKVYNLLDNSEKNIDLPKSSVLYFTNANNDWFSIRPSGTEPKVKIYFGVKADSKDSAKEKLNNIMEDVLKRLE